MVRAKKDKVCLVHENIGRECWGNRRITRAVQAYMQWTEKLDLLVKELKLLEVAIDGMQETKWFGNDVWVSGGHTLLHSGRTLPDETSPQMRNGGMGIVFNELATGTWKRTGMN